MAEPDRVAMISDLRAFRDELSARFEELSDRFEERFGQLEVRLTHKLETRIAEEGETTRRHFNIMVEKVECGRENRRRGELPPCHRAR